VSTYIHGTQPDEQARLAQLNALTNSAFIDFLRVPRGSRVLEVGSGLGILAADVAGAAHAWVAGVEYAWPQLQKAARRGHGAGPQFVRGDAHHLPVFDTSFDVVYARYLLEHVHDPAAVVAEMYRACRAGGVIAVMENDISLIRFDPPCPAFDAVWASFGTLQQRLGGDGLIGRRLFRLLHDAGAIDVELSFQPEAHWHGSPGFAPWVRNIIGNVESARDALVDTGLSSAALIDEAVGELDALTRREDASAGFSWNRARGSRPIISV
jgi:SAM-dependent methyltransferase